MIEEKSKFVAESGTKILFLGISLTAGEAFVAFVDEESFADAEAESFADSFGVSLAAPDAGSSFTSFTSFDSFAFSFTDSKVERFSSLTTPIVLTVSGFVEDLEFSEEEVDVGLLESVFFGDLLLDLDFFASASRSRTSFGRSAGMTFFAVLLPSSLRR